MILQNKVELYHASYTIIEKIDLLHCASGKDFGKGFYLTTSYEQACRFVRTALGKAAKNGLKEIKDGTGFVSLFKFKGIEDKSIEYYEFSGADAEWLHCIAAHRKAGLLKTEIERWQKYDILAGKIANDSTNQVLTAYINGLYGEIGSSKADETAIQLLLPNKLSDQICFRTQKAVDTLSFEGYNTVEI
ncbi:MAG: DUF3990 domain-containing protein [Treponema sp.]|nr:DUF3990 domain-containing protein [Treponema sp.]